MVHVLLLKNPHQFEINLPNKVSTFYLVPIFENVFWELLICSVYWGVFPLFLDRVRRPGFASFNFVSFYFQESHRAFRHVELIIVSSQK